jgi:TetR/AcrR family acrAB operon transcriptional repressor
VPAPTSDIRQMARRTAEEAAQTRESLLDAAQEVFVEKGVSRSTLEDIARRAGCTRGAVYWHFDNKLALLSALLDRTELALFDDFERMMQGAADDPVGALRNMCAHAVDDVMRNPRSRKTMQIVFHRCEFTGDTAALVERHQQRVRWFLDVGERAFIAARERGQIRADLCPRFCALMLHTMMAGLLRDWLFMPDQIDLAPVARAMVDCLLQGFGDTLGPREQDMRALPGCPAAA